MKVASLLIVVTWLALAGLGPRSAHAEDLRWKQLRSLPDAEGFAGPFAGWHGKSLLVAGGANFPDKKPWEGGAKVWYDTVYLLPNGKTEWSKVGRLPRPLGYGVSLSLKQGIYCLGGSDANQHYRDCFTLSVTESGVETTSLPRLPQPVANFCGATVGNAIYVAGGIETPTATTALKAFWKLDLNQLDQGWQQLKPWPGPERMLAVAGSSDGRFYLFGGASLSKGADNLPVRTWLRDAYSYDPQENRWQRLADLPRPAVAAPSPAPLVDNNRLLILGGDDGAQLDTPPTEHRGFPRSILSYNIAEDKWTTAGEVPFSLVTTPVVELPNAIIVPGGEARPGVRSTEVWRGEFPAKSGSKPPR